MDLIQLQFSKYLEGLKYDITHLSRSPYLQQYLHSSDQESRKLLLKEYLSLIHSKPYFSQIRYIGIEENGSEIVRVERRDDTIYEVINKELQQKGNRDYFKEAIRLPRDSMYISSIDLNKEYGKISQPLTPTLRIAYPVYFNQEVRGIIVINTNLSLLFDALHNFTDQISELAIVNNEGFYLFHEDGGETFGFEFGKESTFSKKFGALPNDLLEKTLVFSLNKASYIL